jgi:uncharacterized protein YecT (DUF1311 family)
MKTLTLCFAVAALFSTTAYAASSPEVAKCMELPDNEFMAQLDCLDPILAKSKADLDNAYKAKIASFNGDKKAIQALDKQQKDWKKKLPKSCGEASRPQESGYVEACKIEATNKRTAELSK